mgnify:FL=1
MTLKLRSAFSILAFALAAPLAAQEVEVSQTPLIESQLSIPDGIVGPVRSDSVHVNDAIDALRRAQLAPQSEVPGLEVGEAAPVYRTLQEAAAAGINPLAATKDERRIVVQTISEGPVEASRPLWPMVLAGAALALTVFVLFIVLATRRSRRVAAR